MRNLGSIGLAAGFAIGAIAGAASLPVIAESAAIEEVVVTARKQEESVQDVPIAITALTAELENGSIRNLSDLNGYSPNLVFGADGSRGGGGANINIRGISPTRGDDNSFDAPIAVVVDGVYLGTLAGQVLENFDLERVEVLRGPQGTLFGKNTVGGVVNVIRSRPTGEFGGKFKGTVGNDGQREARAVVNFGLGEKAAIKLFGTQIDYDGFMKNITTGNDVANKDYSNLGLTLLLSPTNNFEAMLTVERFRDEGTLDAYHTNYNVTPGLLPAPPEGSSEGDFSGGFVNCFALGACRTSLDRPEFSENDTDNFYSLDTDAITLNMRLDLNENLSLVSVTGRREVDEYRIYDFDASAAPMITIDRNNVYEQTSQELRIDGNFDRLRFTAGLYYFENEFTQDWYTGGLFWGTIVGLGAGLDLSDPGLLAACQAGALPLPFLCDTGMEPTLGISQVLYENQVTESSAVFAQMDYDITDRLTLTAGLRWTKEEKDFIAGQGYLTSYARESLRQFTDYADLEREWTETSPRVGFTYSIDDSSMVFATYSEGFKSGGFFGVNQNKADFERDQYEPEYASNVEIGYKSQHLDNRFRFNATYFRNSYDQKQESLIALDKGTVTTIFENVGNATYSGLEVEMQYVFNQYIRGFINYGTLDAKYNEFQVDLNPNNDGEEGGFVKEDGSFLIPRNAPDYTLGVGANLSVPLGDGSLDAFVKVTSIASVEASLLNLNQARIARREDIAASLGYYAENWSIEAYGKNLSDSRYEIFFPISTLFAAGTVNRPRSFGVELSYQF